MIRRLLYPLFRRFAGMTHRWRRRFTSPGLLVITGIGVTAIFGIDTSQTLDYQLFAWLMALLIPAMLSTLFFRGRFRASRQLPQFATAGESFSYEIVLENPSDKRWIGLGVEEELADPRPTLAEFQQAREPGEEERNWFDRKVSFHRFMWLIAKKVGIKTGSQQVPTLAPQGEVRIKMHATPKRRGRISFAAIAVTRADPFGLFKGFARVPSPQTLLVLPRRHPFPVSFNLPGGRQYQPGGESLAGSVGDAEEFVSLREYRDGDSPRHIHWPAWARSGKPVVKEFQEEYFTRHALILDTFLQGPEEVFEEAVSVAASMAVTLDSGEALLDWMLLSGTAIQVTTGRGVGGAEQVLEILATVPHELNKPFSQLAAWVLDHVAVLSGVLLILLAWDAERQELVSKLLSRGLPLEVMVIQPRGGGERLNPGPMAGAPQRFHVLEAGQIGEGLAKL
ncbi:MAG: DUF58 domain-containing protein [Magnetococcales bacterium]|nr:DUF58 domain-containing protein [Magnetococcales bacterium]